MAAPPSRRGTPRRRSSAKTSREEPASMEAAPVEVHVEDLASYNESINIMLYGPSGHGKTVLAGGAPNATFLSTEKGVVSAKRSGSKASLIKSPDWEHALSGVRWADDNLGPEDWLIIDSHTKMQILYIRWLLRQKNEENSARDLDIPAIQDHQKWQNAFMRWTDHIIDAQYNSIFICTTMIKEDEEGEKLVLPAITGKDYTICNYVCAQMDVGLYYAISERASTREQVVRRALAQPYPPYFAKDRYSALGDYQDVLPGDYTAMAEFIDLIRETEPKNKKKGRTVA